MGKRIIKLFMFFALAATMFVGAFVARTTVVNAEKHVHNFTYSVEGAQITATCSELDCDLEEGVVSAELKVAGDFGNVYLDGKDAFEAATGQHFDDFQYKTREAGSYWANATPTDIGDYSVRTGLTVGATHYELVLDYDIGNYTYSGPTAKQNLVFNNEEQDLISSGTVESNHGTLYYKLDDDGSWSTSIPTAKDAGTYTVYYYVKGNATTAPGYRDKGSEEKPDGSVSVTIAKFDLTTLNPNNGSFTLDFGKTYYYNGDMQEPDDSLVKFTINFATPYELVFNTDYDVCGTSGDVVGEYDYELYAESDSNFDNSYTAKWKIEKALVEKPTEDTTVFTYNGDYQTYNLGNTVDSSLYTVSNATQKYVDTYTVTVSLDSPENYAWKAAEGETPDSADLTFNFVIGVKKIAVPTADSNDPYTYDGTPKTYTFGNDQDSAWYNCSGDGVTQEDAGTYYIDVNLNDPLNTCWDDESSSILPKSFTFNIKQFEVEIPTEDSTVFTYNGEEQTYTIADSTYYIVTGNQATDAGTYPVNVELADKKNTCWKGLLSTDDQQFTFVINQYELSSSFLTVTGSPLTYNGQEQIIDWSYSDPAFTSIALGTHYQVKEGTDRATNASSSLSLELEVVDSKNITGSASASWIISPFTLSDATAKITLVDETLTYNATEQTRQIEKVEAKLDGVNYTTITLTTDYTVTGDKAIHVDADPSTFEVLDDHTITVSGTGNYDGSLDIDWSMEQYLLDLEWGETKSFPYNGKEQAPDTILKTVFEGDTVNVVLEGKEKNVNTYHGQKYTVAAASLDNSDYKIPEGLTCEYAITQIVAELEWSDLELIYNGDDQVPTCKIANLKDPDEKYIINLYVEGSHSDAGKYTAKAINIEGNENYRLPVHTDANFEDISREYKINPFAVKLMLEGDGVEVVNGDVPSFIIDLNTKGDFGFVKLYFENEIGVKKYANVDFNDYIGGDVWKTIDCDDEYMFYLKWSGLYDGDLTKNYLPEIMSSTSAVIPNVCFRRIKVTAFGETDYVYNGKAQNPVVGLKDENGYTITDNAKVVSMEEYKNVGEGYMSYVLIDTENAKRFAFDPDAATSEDRRIYEFYWNITPATLTFEAKDENPELVYNGKSQHPEIKINGLFGSDTTDLYFANEGVVVGDYTLLITGVSNPNYIPATNSSVPFKIIPLELDAPAEDTTEFIYNFAEQTYNVEASDYYQVSNNTHQNVGTYTVTVSLKDKVNVQWKGGSTDDVKFTMSIAKLQIAQPTEDATVYTYNGAQLTYTLDANKGYTVSNNKQINAGTYDVTVSLVDTNNTEWDDASVKDLHYTFVINKKQVAIPENDNTVYTYTGSQIAYQIPSDSDYSASNDKQINAGTYDVVVRLTDKLNTEWDDASVTDQHYSFVINKKQIAIPDADETVYTFTGSQQAYQIPVCSDYIVSNDKQINVGTYDVTVALKDINNTEWDNASVADQHYSFVIGKKGIVRPEANNTEYVYNKENQVYQVALDDAYEVSNNNRTVAGKQTVLVRLLDKANTQWEDGKTDDMEFEFVIAKYQVEAPVENEAEFVFNRQDQKYDLATSEFYTISNDTRRNVGNQNVKVVLNDKANYEWIGGGDADLSFVFAIARLEVEAPEANNTEFVYNGANQVYSLVADDNYFINNNERTLVGSQTVVVELKDKDNTCWKGGSVDNLSFNFSIAQQKVAIPEADGNSFIYNANPQTYSINSNNAYSISNNVRTNVGSQTVVVDLLDKANYCWEDGSIAPQTYTFSISKLQVAIPEADQTVYTYNGAQLVYQIVADSNYSVSNNKQINANTYDVVVSLKDKVNTEWDDSSVADQHYSFVINKKQITRPEEDATVYTYNGLQQTYIIPVNSDYIVANDKQIKAGTYDVVVSLMDINNTEWDNQSVDALHYSFVINKKGITMPEADENPYVYNEMNHVYTIAEDPAYLILNNNRTVAGQQKVIVKLVDKENTFWEDGSSDDMEFDFVVAKRQVEKPVENETEFVYNYAIQKYDLATSEFYTISNDTRRIVGSQDVIVVLNDKANYEWIGGGDDDLSFVFAIAKLQIEMPLEDETEYVYDAHNQVYSLVENEAYEISNNNRTLAGKQIVNVRLLDKDNTEWTSGSIDDLKFDFVIAKRQVVKPVENETEFVYNYEIQEYYLDHCAHYTISNNTRRIVGSQNVSVVLNDKANFEWVGGGDDDLSFVFTINKLQIEMPLEDETEYVYDAHNQVYSLVENEAYEISNNNRTLAGKQIVNVRLLDKDNTEWTSGSIDDLKFDFVIAKRQVVKPVENETEFVYNYEIQKYDLAKSEFYTISNDTRRIVGSQNVSVVLKDKANFEWVGGGHKDLSFVFTINKLQIEMPVEDETSYVYDEENHVYSLVENEAYEISNNNRTLAGKQIVNVRLLDKDNTEWTSGSTDDLKFDFVIAKHQVEKPVINETEFVYNHEIQKYELATSEFYTISNDTRRIVGSQNVSVVLNDKANYEWIGGGDGDLSFVFAIAKLQIEMPLEDETEYVYDEENHVYSLVENEAYEISNNNRTLAGKQIVNVRLLDKDNTEWTSGSTDDMKFDFVIAKQQVEKPVINETEFVYNHEIQKYELATSEFYTISNDTRRIVGSQNVSVVLNDKANYEWIGGGDDDLSFVFAIAKLQIEMPVEDETQFVYSGANQEYSLVSNDHYFIKNAERTVVGSQYVVVELKDKDNTEWTSGSIDDLSFLFNIAQQKVAIPEVDGTNFIFNGQAQVYAIAENNNYTVTNNVRTNVGTQTVVVDLLDKANYCWEDSSIAPQTYTFSIAKFEVAIPEADETRFIYNGMNQVYDLAESKYYHIDNNDRIASGSQIVTATLLDSDNTCWVGGSIAVQNYEFVIEKLVLDIPAVNNTNFIYDGNSQQYVLATSKWYEIRNDFRTNPGRQMVSVELINKEDTVWEDRSTTDKLYEFCMKQRFIFKVNYCDCNCDGLTYDTPVAIQYSYNGILPEYGLVVKDVENERYFYKQLLENDLIIRSQSVHEVYAVTLVDDATEVKPDGMIVVLMYIPEELQDKEFSIYRFSNGEIDEMVYTAVDENGYVTFEVDELCEFVIVDHQGCYSHWILIALIVILIAFFCIRFFYYKKKEADLIYAIACAALGIAMVVVAALLSVPTCIPCIISLVAGALSLGTFTVLLLVKPDGEFKLGNALEKAILAMGIIFIALIIALITVFILV